MTALTAHAARWTTAAALGVAAALAAGPAGANLLEQPPRPTTFKLDDPAAAEPLPLLYAFRNAAIERPGPMRLYLGGRYGKWLQRPWQTLSWRLLDAAAPPVYGPVLELVSTGDEPAEPLPPAAKELLPPEAPAPVDLLKELLEVASASSPSWLRRLDPAWSLPPLSTTGPSLASNGFNLVWDPPPKPVRDWRCRRRPITFARYGGEHASFQLLGCDGAIAPGAIDRLSILARPPAAPSPGELLPDEPDAEAWQDREWVPQVRVLHPRLLWALQRIADAFPYRTIYIFSGYRPRAESRRGHHSLHAEGRAMDITVMGVPNVALFKHCRKLDDVACGFYPNSKFVHVDVRRPATGHPFWIDISGPGEPSRYVDAWPGITERAGTSWSARGAETTAPPSP